MTRPLGYSVERQDDGRIALVVPSCSHPDSLEGDGPIERTLTPEAARALRDALTAALGETDTLHDRVGAVLSDNGCDCDCGHDPESHNENCERCLACRVQAALDGAE